MHEDHPGADGKRLEVRWAAVRPVLVQDLHGAVLEDLRHYTNVAHAAGAVLARRPGDHSADARGAVHLEPVATERARYPRSVRAALDDAPELRPVRVTQDHVHAVVRECWPNAGEQRRAGAKCRCTSPPPGKGENHEGPTLPVNFSHR